ncbi:hypothetical protein Pka01_31950 [Planotetraspora kaengkrachanensis]|uniref:Uncharacterized protein n=1 Tax=Planotetraspora kaengkrachanensis TaxID=575193 RepID=A0A8J3M0X8_9ACTN|nr:hypothetical protein Pka01_31950 [Planotetraspora kaengkrachanensis]
MQLEHLRREEHALRIALAASEIYDDLHPKPPLPRLSSRFLSRFGKDQALAPLLRQGFAHVLTLRIRPLAQPRRFVGLNE